MRGAARAALMLAILFSASTMASPSAAAAASTPPAEPPSITWAVTPSGPEGPDGRASVDLVVDPGGTATDYLAVRNLSDVEATFSLIAADGFYTAKGRFDMLSAGQTSTGAGTWIEVQRSVTIAPGRIAVVPYTVSVPANATPGDHAAGIAASVRSSSVDPDGTLVGVDSRVGFRVSTRVTGELAPAMRITEVSAQYVPSWSLLQPGRVIATYTAANAGNTALRIRDALGGGGGTQGLLLPGETRAMSVAMPDAWPWGVLTLDLAVVGADPDAQAEEVSFVQGVVVWAVPWLYIALLVGVLLIVIAIFAGRRRGRRRLDLLLEQTREEVRREMAPS